MENHCCDSVQIQWYPDPNGGPHNLVCANCGTTWTPYTQQLLAPPVPVVAAPAIPAISLEPFEDQVIKKIDAIMSEFSIEQPIGMTTTMEGGGVYENSWHNLEAQFQDSTKKSWSKSALITEMSRTLQESKEEVTEDPVENSDPEQDNTPS